ncbi:lysozyme 2-like [Centruroides vittatus]|uniref:lysozyme 2-like n=1 Tax=Centruroides vittatus TaxID=120091 RepID=UPI00350F615C
MHSFGFYVAFFAVVFVMVVGQGFHPSGYIHPSCLECMCQASSGCKDTQCHSNGPNQYYCGPFHISYTYWVDGGSPGADPNNPFDFEECLNDRSCAEGAVRGYMQKWGHDCNYDGLVDCYDYARIHKSGPYGCNGTWVTSTDYWKVFLNCYEQS